MYGLIKLPLVPLRINNSECSEMTSQLLFGEYVRIKEKQEKWIYIENVTDDYSGWIDAKMVMPVTELAFLKSRQMKVCRLQSVYNMIYNAELSQKKLIPGGSFIYELNANDFMIGDEIWTLSEPGAATDGCFNAHRIIETALQYVNAPYLWGGKSVLGIDCSGLVQVVYSIGGYSLPRNAYMQATCGESVFSLSEALPGDLAFFGKEGGGITHVGMLIDNTHIIHASGWVKIEKMDYQGIISSTTGEYTHQLRAIRRILLS